jgi:hypothetical protein
VYHTLNQRSTESASRVVMFAYLDEDKGCAGSTSRAISSSLVGIASPSRLGRLGPSITSLSITRASNVRGGTLLPPVRGYINIDLHERSEFHLKGIDSQFPNRVLKKFSDPKKTFLPPADCTSLPIKKFPYKE